MERKLKKLKIQNKISVLTPFKEWNDKLYTRLLYAQQFQIIVLYVGRCDR